MTNNNSYSNNDGTIFSARAIANIESVLSAHAYLELPVDAAEQSLRFLVERLRNPRREIGVVGIAGHGKSTLLNALLGYPLLYMGAEIATSHVIRIRYGEPRVELINLAGKVRKMPLERLQDIGHHGSDIFLEPGTSVTAYCLAPFLFNGLCLVDTPGLDAGLGNDFDDATTINYLREAEMFLLAIRADKPGSSRVFDFLHQARQPGTAVVVALTAADLLENDEDELEESLETIARTARERLGEEVPVLPTSARRHAQGLPDSVESERWLAALAERLHQEIEQQEGHLLATAAEAIRHAGEIWREILLQQEKDATSTVALKTVVWGKVNDSVKNEVFRLDDATYTIRKKEARVRPEIAKLLIKDRDSSVIEACKFVDQTNIPGINANLQDLVNVRVDFFLSEAINKVQNSLEQWAEEWATVALADDEEAWAVWETVLSSIRTKVIANTPKNVSVSKLDTGFFSWIGDPFDENRRSEVKRKITIGMNVAFHEIETGLVRQAEAWIRRATRVLLPAIETREAAIKATVKVPADQLHQARQEQESIRAKAEHLDFAISTARLRLAALRLEQELSKPLCQSAIVLAEDYNRLYTGSGIADDSHTTSLCQALMPLAARLDYLKTRFGDLSTDVFSYHVHMAAGLALAQNGNLPAACAQLTLTVSLADHTAVAQGAEPLSNSELRFLVRSCIAEFRNQGKLQECIRLLDGHPQKDKFREERLAIALFEGDSGAAAHVLRDGRQSGFGNEEMQRLFNLARYATGKKVRVQSNWPSSLNLLIRAETRVNVERETPGFARGVSIDPSLARHVAARLLRQASLSEQERIIVERAFPKLTPFEALLPASSQEMIEQVLIPVPTGNATN